LKEAGVEIESESGKFVTGRIALTKLPGIADISEVIFVLPVY
jgi:hypothetical protein